MTRSPRLLTRNMRRSGRAPEEECAPLPSPQNETPDLPPHGYSPTPLMSPKPSRLWRWTKRLLKLAMLGLVLLVLLVGGSYAWFSRDLPSVEELRTWRPPQVTKVNCRDGSICAEFYKERRYLIPYEKMPEKLIQAFISAEDPIATNRLPLTANPWARGTTASIV